MTDLDRAAIFGAMAMAKVQNGEPTTDAEDRVVLSSVGYRVMQSVEAGRTTDASRDLIAA